MGGIAWYYERENVIRRAARRLPATPIGDVVEGVRVKIVGRIAPLDDALASPVTVRRCVAYRVELQALDEGRRVFLHDEQARDFWVCDDSGARAQVRASLANVVYGRGAELRTHPSTTPPPGLQAFLDQHPGHYSIREGALMPGQQVTIVGRARRVPDLEGGHATYRDPPSRLVFDADPLFVVALAQARQDR
jgi:hypothetical protein